MSVIVTFCLYDGIVMAADSRTTLTKTYPDGRKEVSHEEYNEKVRGDTIRCHIVGYENGLQWIHI